MPPCRTGNERVVVAHRAVVVALVVGAVAPVHAAAHTQPERGEPIEDHLSQFHAHDMVLVVVPARIVRDNHFGPVHGGAHGRVIVDTHHGVRVMAHRKVETIAERDVGVVLARHAHVDEQILLQLFTAVLSDLGIDNAFGNAVTARPTFIAAMIGIEHDDQTRGRAGNLGRRTTGRT